MANAAITPAYALNLTLVLDKYYNMPKGVGFDVALVLSSQMIGFAFAGFCRVRTNSVHRIIVFLIQKSFCSASSFGQPP